MGHAEHVFRAPPPCGTCRPASRPAARLFEPPPARHPAFPRAVPSGMEKEGFRTDGPCGTRLPRPAALRHSPPRLVRSGTALRATPARHPAFPLPPFPPAWKRKDFGQTGHAEHAFRAPAAALAARPCASGTALRATRYAALRPASAFPRLWSRPPCAPHPLPLRPCRRAGPSSAEKAEEQGMPPGKESPARRFRAPPAGPGEERAALSGRHSARTCRSLRHGPPRRIGTSSLRSIGPASSRPRSGAAWRKRADCPGLSGVRPIGRGPAQHRQTRRPAPAARPSCGFRPRRSLRRETEAARAPALFPPEPLARTLRRTACLPREAQAPHAQFPELPFRP